MSLKQRPYQFCSVESYTFNFSYPDKDLWCITIDALGKESFSLKTRSEIMNATSLMLRRLLILTQTLKVFPDAPRWDFICH